MVLRLESLQQLTSSSAETFKLSVRIVSGSQFVKLTQTCWKLTKLNIWLKAHGIWIHILFELLLLELFCFTQVGGLYYLCNFFDDAGMILAVIYVWPELILAF